MRNLIITLLIAGAPFCLSAQESERPRARDLGMTIGIFDTGEHNAITDVTGVRVGHTTVIEGDSIRTGVTAILPHGGNLYSNRVPAGIHVGNGLDILVPTPREIYDNDFFFVTTQCLDAGVRNRVTRL